MQARTVRRSSLLGIGVLSVSVLIGCASAPVQEMSNARQAIRAAQDAGASTKAASTLAEAQSALNRAESQLNKRMYRSARHNAEEAHRKALTALDQSRIVPKEAK